MKKIFFAFCAAVLSLAACSEKEGNYSGMAAPVIELMYESINPDLNRVDNTPVVCVVFSEAGLRSVSLYKMESEE